MAFLATSREQPWRLGGNTFTTWCGDLNGDGLNDLYSAEIHHWHIGQSSDSSELLVNTPLPDGGISFVRPGNQATGMIFPHPTSDWNEGGLMAAGGDLDNDGRMDMVVAASDYPDQFGLIFHQKPNGTFEEVGSPSASSRGELWSPASLSTWRMSIARRVPPSRLALKSLSGSVRSAPLKKVSFTTAL